MAWTLSPISLALLITAGTLVMLAVIAWGRRGVTRGARSFTFLILSAAIWALLEALQASDPDPLRSLTWRQLKYLGVAALPVAFVVFARDYTRDGSWLDRYVVAALLVVPAVTVGLAWTNPWHGWMWISGAGAPQLVPEPTGDRGSWFWVHTAYSYALLALGSYYLVRGLLRTPSAQRAQLGWVLLAVAIPWGASLGVVLGLVSTRTVDPTPVAFALSAFAFARSLFSHRLLDIVPVAQEEVVRHLGDAVIVADEHGRTLQMNPSASQLLGVGDERAVVGVPMAELVGHAPGLVEALRTTADARFDVQLRVAGRMRTFDAQLRALTDRRGRVMGRLMRLQDIDRQVEAERTLALAESTLRHQESYVLALQEVTEGLMRRAPLGALLAAVVRHAGDVLEAPHGFLDLVDPRLGSTRRAQARGRFAGADVPLARPGEGLAGRVWADRAPLRVDDYGRWDGRLPGVDLTWAKAAVAAPLASREGVLGVIALARERDDDRLFTSADEAELARFAELAALAVLNVRLIDELEARRRESEQLARIANAMQTVGTVDERMALVLQAIPRVVGLQRAVIWLPDANDEALVATAWVGFGDEASGAVVPLDEGVPMLSEAYRRGREIVIEAHASVPPDLRAAPPFTHHPLVRSRAAAVLPLVARGTVVGVLAADTPTAGQPLGESVEVLRRFATSAAVAIDAARLLSTAQAELAERRAAEQELRRSEEKYRGILEQIEEAYFETDARGRFTLANRSLQRSLGATRSQLVGESFRPFVDEASRRDVMRTFREVWRSGRPALGVQIRYRNLTQGTTSRAEMSISLVRGEGGERGGFRGVVRDIEDRLRHEEELQAAKDAAEAANASKSAFLANVSHELRTPLTSILGFSRLIERRFDEVLGPHLERIDDPRLQRAALQVRGNAAIINRESRRLTTLIDNVLDLAKIEAGRVEWRMERVAPDEVVTQALEATRGLLDDKPRVRLRWEHHDDVPDVIADRDRLVQVLINLVSNAVKFTPEGEIVVRLERAGGEVHVSVRDTGVGIAPEDHRTVFEQFRQVGDTLTEKPQGTGLGLPICKQIVEHHGGRLWLESARGQGATFAFSLPGVPAGATAPTVS
jgi:PAS domain S-box-containing protein